MNAVPVALKKQLVTGAHSEDSPHLVWNCDLSFARKLGLFLKVGFHFLTLS